MEYDREDSIRQRAYQIWLEEGQPQGEDLKHWLQAAAEIADAGSTANATPAEAPAASTDEPSIEAAPAPPETARRAARK